MTDRAVESFAPILLCYTSLSAANCAVKYVPRTLISKHRFTSCGFRCLNGWSGHIPAAAMLFEIYENMYET
jgi:hypothetical protein